MKKTKFLILLLIFPLLSFGQLEKYKTEQHESDGYTYETVTNDPLKARIYTLGNGLKVYMTVYKDAPRIQTYIAVRAGSKNDPPELTGLAHYLEHMLFKGTSKIGTVNWQEEKKQLDTIEALFEEYRQTTSDVKRAHLYKEIDSVSQLAAQYAVPNEYDKMVSNLGATGTNAYTFVEQTVYVNNIPSNALEKWADIEGERFGMLAPRLFHTELEAVYEEKNRGLDSDGRKLWEAMLAGIFPDHPYGTQTTIGTVEHLKNPSVSAIKEYFNKYYRPNNMAICLSGDFDPDKAIRIIDNAFSRLRPLDIPDFEVPQPKPVTSIHTDTVYGPNAESVTLAWRFKGRQNMGFSENGDSGQIMNPDPYLLKVISMLLSNGQAGLIDQNLNHKQQVLGASAYDLPLNDYSLLVMTGKPKQGQSLDQVRNLLLAQVDSLKTGNFSDWLVEAVINDYKISRMKAYESNKARADAFVDAFISHTPWKLSVMEPDILQGVTKEDIVSFVKTTLRDNYELVYKKTGKDTGAVKVTKPAITPVKLNRDEHSEFYTQVMEEPMGGIEPVFLDYSKDLKITENKRKVPVLYEHNKENDLFNLYYIWDIGKKEDPLYGIATGYMSYLGTSKLSNEQLNQEFYKLGCTYSFSASDDAIIFSLSGLNEHFDQAYKLFENVIKNVRPDDQALENYVGRILKSREDSKKSKDVILRAAMASYAKYGSVNPFTNIVPADRLKDLKGQELIDKIHELYGLEHRILYYGPEKMHLLVSQTGKYHVTPPKLKPVDKTSKFSYSETDSNKVYFVNYDMVQAEVIFLSKSDNYHSDLSPSVVLFNEYFGGSMGSLVFQEMREARALAYSVKSAYAEANREGEPNYVYAYIGTQADKLHEAIEGMEGLMNDMPESETLFNTAKAAVLENIRTQRITKANILWNYERATKLGLDRDIREDIYEQVQKMTFEDVKTFQEQYFKDKPQTTLIIGSEKKIKPEELKKYGEVEKLSLEQLFGY